MSNQEISKLLYEEMAAAFDAYKSVEEEYRAQTEYCEKQSILARLIQARGAWLGSWKNLEHTWLISGRGQEDHLREQGPESFFDWSSY